MAVCIYIFAMAMVVVAFGTALGLIFVAVVVIYASIAWAICLHNAIKTRNLHWAIDLFLAPTSSLLGILVIGPAIGRILVAHPGAGVINLPTQGGGAIIVDLLAAAVGLACLVGVLYMLVMTPIMLASEPAVRVEGCQFIVR